MGTRPSEPRAAAEQRFVEVFSHLGLITAYARRRGVRDPSAIAAEVMAIAWRRLADVPLDDPRPWLIATTRNLVLTDRRKHPPEPGAETLHSAETADQPYPAVDLDPELEIALRALSRTDREALLLVAWEDLTPKSAAASLGITQAAFRVRLHRARRRLVAALAEPEATRPAERRHPAPVEEA